MRRVIELPDGPLVYEWEKKEIKHLHVRLRPGGTVWVSSPRRMPLEEVEAFLQDKAAWIRRAQARQAVRHPVVQEDAVYFLGRRLPVQVRTGERDEAHVEAQCLSVTMRDPADGTKRTVLVKAALERAGAPVLEDALRRMYALARPLGVPFPRMTTRWAVSRWGSCAAGRGWISINKALACTPPECVEYVLLHELAHFLHPDHSPAFYAVLKTLMPDFRERERRLREYNPRV